MKNLKVEYPEAYEILSKDISEELLLLMSAETKASEEFNTFFQSIVVTSLDAILTSNYSKIASILDKHDINTTIQLIFEPGKVTFKANINGVINPKVFNNRKSAEEFIIENSLEMLNNRIS
jgi:hypothetical protein